MIASSCHSTSNANRKHCFVWTINCRSTCVKLHRKGIHLHDLLLMIISDKTIQSEKNTVNSISKTLMIHRANCSGIIFYHFVRMIIRNEMIYNEAYKRCFVSNIRDDSKVSQCINVNVRFAYR